MEVGKEGDCVYIYKTNKNQRKTTSCIYICLSLHCHHQNDFCIKMGSDESHFNVSLIVRGNVTKQCPQTATFEEKGEPKPYRTEVLPLTSLPPYR